MKRLRYSAIYVIALVLLTSCSKDDETPEIISGDYLPSTKSNYWNYDVAINDVKNNKTENFQDYLTVDSESSSSFGLEANSGNGAYGTMNGILVNGTLKKINDKLTIDGKIEIPVEGIDDFYIDFNSAILYDLNADANKVLSTFNGEFTQDLGGFPLKISYELSFSKVKNHSSFKVNNNTYNKVTESKISLNLGISTTVDVAGISKTLSLIEAQDVMSINSYYGENVGLLKSIAVIKFELDAATVTTLETLGINVEIPASQEKINTQALTTYVVK